MSKSEYTNKSQHFRADFSRKMKSDCGDVRFTDGLGNQLSNTMASSTCNSSNTVFYVIMDLIGNTNNSVSVLW
jgi:hypothetical protein